MLNDKTIDDVVEGLNEHAVQIMTRHSIPMVDLYAPIIAACGAVPQTKCWGQKGCWSPHCPCAGKPSNCCPATGGVHCESRDSCPVGTCPCMDAAQPRAIDKADTCGYAWLTNGTLVPALRALLPTRSDDDNNATTVPPLPLVVADDPVQAHVDVVHAGD